MNYTNQLFLYLFLYLLLGIVIIVILTQILSKMAVRISIKRHLNQMGCQNITITKIDYYNSSNFAHELSQGVECTYDKNGIRLIGKYKVKYSGFGIEKISEDIV